MARISNDPKRRGGDRHSKGGRTRTEKLSIGCYTKQDKWIMKTGWTLVVHSVSTVWGYVGLRRERSPRCEGDISRSINFPGVSNK
jgi:hypothetical protein